MATTQTFGGGVHPREIGNGKSATQSQQIVNAARRHGDQFPSALLHPADDGCGVRRLRNDHERL